MPKLVHEIRDPIHVFIRLDSDERKVLDSRPFQRLRYIHQLALTYLVYPGATHRRFEHSLGVMELASRVYDIVTDPKNISHDTVRKVVPVWGERSHQYWKCALRMAALCHDLGHLPFSHAAEQELLPPGWSHESLTVELIKSPEMASLWGELNLNPNHVAMLAVGPKHYADDVSAPEFSDWQAILAEIISGDVFGVDRIDYLLRDSLHAGVGYGKFDHYRLIDTLRILPKGEDGSEEPALGVEIGGLHSAESLLMARYFMFQQLYLHPVRRIYDIHLKDFLGKWLDGGRFSVQIDDHLKMTDNEVTAALARAASDPTHPGHVHADRIVGRKHFKLLYERNSRDQSINPEAARRVFDAACGEFGEAHIRYDPYAKEDSRSDFPVLMRDQTVGSALRESRVLLGVPPAAVEYVFVSRECFDRAQEWLRTKRDAMMKIDL
ncbi:MAG: HD domain-containing protein [Chloroflexi bacterium]|nr:HD domain-containing protein [Chloroflexota bacterium]